MFFKLLLIPKLLKARSLVLITEKSDHSSVSIYDDEHFWAYAKKRLAVLEKQHYVLSGQWDVEPKGKK